MDVSHLSIGECLEIEEKTKLNTEVFSLFPNPGVGVMLFLFKAVGKLVKEHAVFGVVTAG